MILTKPSETGLDRSSDHAWSTRNKHLRIKVNVYGTRVYCLNTAVDFFLLRYVSSRPRGFNQSLGSCSLRPSNASVKLGNVN